MLQFGKDLPAWKRLYQAAILELDSGKLPERISDARRAIHDRNDDASRSSSLSEYRALNSALRTLKILEEIAEREKNAA